MKKLFLLTLSLALGFGAIAQQRMAKNDIRSGVARAQKVTVGKETVDPSAAQFAPQAPVVVSSRYQGDLDYAGTIMSFYDLQSNSFVANRMYQMPNGSVAITATMSHLTPNNTTPADRGTGYNFYKPQEGKEFATGEWIYGTVENGEGPEARVESWVSGWPSIAQWGDNGEILLSRPGREWSPLAITTTSSTWLPLCNTASAATRPTSARCCSARKMPRTGR